MGRYNNKSSSSSVNMPAERTIRVNNKINGGNNSPRKRKSPTQNNNDWQQAGDYNNNEDVKMGVNLGINLINFFLSRLKKSCKRPQMGRLLTTRGVTRGVGGGVGVHGIEKVLELIQREIRSNYP